MVPMWVRGPVFIVFIEKLDNCFFWRQDNITLTQNFYFCFNDLGLYGFIVMLTFKYLIRIQIPNKHVLTLNVIWTTNTTLKLLQIWYVFFFVVPTLAYFAVV